MRKMLIVYNPRSSRYGEVREKVLEPVRKLRGYMIGKYEIEEIGIDRNVTKLAKLLDDGDLVVAVGGDATGVIVANGILKSGKDAILAALPYGNFNDLARTLGLKRIEDALNEKARVEKLYPLAVEVDGRFWRYATCYVTIGMMAEVVKIYDKPKMRKILRGKFGRWIGSYTNATGWYFKNRKRKIFLSEFELNGKIQPKGGSDYIAVNGRSMARIMKGGRDYLEQKTFKSKVEKLTGFWRLFSFMMESVFIRVPGNETGKDVIEFLEPTTVELQAEGEYEEFRDVKKIEVRKAEQFLRVIALR